MNALTKLSPEQILLDGLRELQCSQAFFVSLQEELSPSKLNLALCGSRPLGGLQAERLIKLLHELQELCQSVSPIPVRFTNPELFRRLLQEQRDRHEQERFQQR